MLEMPSFSSWRASSATSEIGVSCRFSSRFWAVTITSSSPADWACPSGTVASVASEAPAIRADLAKGFSVGFMSVSPAVGLERLKRRVVV